MKAFGGLIINDLSIVGFDFEENFVNVVNINQSLKILSSFGFEWLENDEIYLINYLNSIHYFD